MAEWFVSHRGKTHGPFSSGQLKQLATTHQITPATDVRLGADGKWTHAKNVKGLFEAKDLVAADQSAATAAAPSQPAKPATAVTVKQPAAVVTTTKPVVVPTAVVPAAPQSTSIVVTRIPCPFCGEEIAETAIKCRHCNEFLDGRQRTQQPVQVNIAGAAPPVVNVNMPRRTSSLGVSSLILGIIAFLFCWIPFIGILAMPLAALGLLLAGIGLLVAIIRRGTGVGYPIAGGAVCGFAFMIGMAQVSVIGSTAAALGEMAEQETRTNQEVVGEPEQGTNIEPSQGIVETLDPETVVRVGDAADGAGTVETSVPDVRDTAKLQTAQLVGPEPQNVNEPSQEWASARSPVRQGDVQVSIVDVRVGKAKLNSTLADEFETDDAYLSIGLLLRNVSDSKKIDYKTWQGADFAFDRDYATVTDNFGNTYKRMDFGFDAEIVGQTKSDSIHPNKLLRDTLVFEQPIATVQHLDLELPASNFGGQGMLRIRIPAEMIAD